MDICLVTGNYPPLEGGHSSFCYGLAKKLVAFGNKVTIITFHPKMKMEYTKNERLTILRMPLPNLGIKKVYNPITFIFKIIFLSLGLFILKPVKRYKIIHAMDHSLAGIPGILFSFFTRIPLIVRVPADLHFHVVTELGWDKSSKLSKFVLILQNSIFQVVTRIIVTNKYVHNMLRDYGVTTKKITIIPNAVDTKRFRPPQKKENMKQKFGFKKNKILILSVGRLVPLKRLEDLIYAFADVCTVVKKDLHLLIVGSGPDMERLKRISKEVGVYNNTSFLGRVSNVKIHEIYQAADIFVLSSLHETFGIVVLEAMASGVPTVVARSDGVISIFTDKINCLMYEPGNVDELKKAIIELTTNDRLQRELTDRGHNMVLADYSFDSITQQTLTLYEEL